MKCNRGHMTAVRLGTEWGRDPKKVRHFKMKNVLKIGHKTFKFKQVYSVVYRRLSILFCSRQICILQVKTNLSPHCSAFTSYINANLFYQHLILLGKLEQRSDMQRWFYKKNMYLCFLFFFFLTSQQYDNFEKK